VTCPSVLAEFGELAADPGDGVGLPQGLQSHKHLNLGWLMLSKTDAPFALPEAISGIPDPIRERAVLISDKLFSQIVNSNLEVRTSVSIDPETGAAADKALFTYEAMPRSAILWLDVVEDDFSGKFPKEHPKAQVLNHIRPLNVVTAGLKLAEMLGIGGMGTRGFGRVRLLNGEDAQ
jgi:CRISPR-associated protein Cmr4